MRDAERSAGNTAKNIALIVLALLVVYHCVGRLFKGGKQDAAGATNAA